MTSASRNAEFCKACFSSDRKMIPVTNDMTVLRITLHHSVTHLCWECKAQLSKFIKFRNRVQKAQDELKIYEEGNQMPSQCYSSLSKSKTQSTFWIPEIPVEFDHRLGTSDCKTEKSENYEPLLTIVKSEVASGSGFVSIPDSFDSGNELMFSFPLTFKPKLEYSVPKITDEIDDDLETKYGQTEESRDDASSLTIVKNEVGSETGFVGSPECFDKGNKLPANDQTCDVADSNHSEDEPLPAVKSIKPSKIKRTKNNDAVSDKPETQQNSTGVVKNTAVMKKLAALNMTTDQIYMVRLTWEEVEEERKKSLQSDSFTRHTHRCERCAVSFNHSLKLKNHMKKHDPSNGSFVCQFCSVCLKNSNSLNKHLRAHQVRWRCVLCGGGWSCANFAADHYSQVHAKGEGLSTRACRVCNEELESWGQLRTHMRKHGQSQNCEICNKTFSNSNALRVHSFIHKGEKEYACQHCDKKFLFKQYLDIHQETHQPSAMLYCQECDVVFKSRLSYKHHMRATLKHMDPARLKHGCDVCEKRFATAERLEEHSRAVHLGIKPIACAVPDCHFTCSSRPVLRTHVRMIHRNVQTRNHVCHLCGKAFHSKAILESHVHSHTGERPYKCKLCPATFGHKGARYTHNKLVHLKMKKSDKKRNPPVDQNSTNS